MDASSGPATGVKPNATSFLPPLIPVRATGVLRRSLSNTTSLVLQSGASKRSSGGKILPRCEDWFDLRRDVLHAAQHDCQTVAGVLVLRTANCPRQFGGGQQIGHSH